MAQLPIYIIPFAEQIYLIAYLFFFKMAWTSKGEEVCEALKDYLSQLKPKQKEDLSKTYDQAVTPFWGEWKTMNGVAFVTLRNGEYVLDNLSLAMFKEIVGLGTQWY